MKAWCLCGYDFYAEFSKCFCPKCGKSILYITKEGVGMIDALPFRKLKFVQENSLSLQLAHVKSEIMELELAILNESAERQAEEAGDLAQSAVTLMYIIEHLYGIHPLDVVTRNNTKNHARGYDAC
jgi:hypothetical protein